MTHLSQLGSTASGPVSCTFQDTGDTVTSVAHGLSSGHHVVFTTCLSTTGIVLGTEYFVVNPAADTFQVSGTSGGAAITLTTDGSGAFIRRDVLVGSTDAVGDYFGSAVDASADYLVIGSPGNNDAGSDAGAAFTFERAGSEWVEVAKFLGAAAGELFGSAVAVGGDVIVIGAHNADTYGAAYVYKRVGGTWTFQQKLVAPIVPVNQHNFGRALAISGDGAVIIVGMPSGAFNTPGWAYVYRYNSGTSLWDDVSDVNPADVAANDTYGSSVAISEDGTRCVVGSPFDDDTASASGSLYVFDYSGGVWAQTAKLHASDAADSDYLGQAVGISADGTVIAGAASRDDDAGVDAGAVYIFELVGTWTQTAKLVSYVGPAPSRYLGYRGTTTQTEPGHQRIVFVDSSTILVPSFVDMFYSGLNSGACRCFVAAPSWAAGYSEYAMIPDGAANNMRCGACAVSGTELIVGKASPPTGLGVAYRITDLPWDSGGSTASTAAYLMQAADSITGAMHYWTSTTPDWAAAGYPGPNAAVDVAVAGRTRETG